MNRLVRYLASLIFLFLIGCLSLSCNSSQANPMLVSGKPVLQDATVEFKANPRIYRTWRLVNPTPVRLTRSGNTLGAMCADPISAGVDNPHHQKYISVYVNEAGERAMFSDKAPRFPAGTIIVKEKRDTAGESAPVLMTVMIKHESGYAEKMGDWDFLVMDGEARKVEKPEKIEACWSCHVGFSKSDYVTRLYISEEEKAGLK